MVTEFYTLKVYKSVNVIANLQILIYFLSGARKCNANQIH